MDHCLFFIISKTEAIVTFEADYIEWSLNRLLSIDKHSFSHQETVDEATILWAFTKLTKIWDSWTAMIIVYINTLFFKECAMIHSLPNRCLMLNKRIVAFLLENCCLTGAFPFRQFLFYIYGHKIKPFCDFGKCFKPKLVISDAVKADVNASKNKRFRVRVLSDRILFSGRSPKYSRTTSTSRRKVYFSFWGLWWLNIPDIKL